MIAIIASGYYTLRAIAAVQIGRSFVPCVDENRFPDRSQFKTEEEAKAAADAVIGCMEKRNGFLARLFFDMSEARRDLTFTDN